MKTGSTTDQAGRWSPDERGEGVISAAIAVLVMAFIGVAMWFAFSATFQHAASHVNQQVNCIGQSQPNC
jgi:type IV secretory pathway VirB6-like protein